MKQTIRFIAIAAMSAAIAFGAGVIVLALSGNERAFFCTFIFGAVLIALAMGAFDVERKNESQNDTIRHYDGRKGYGQAAIFVGTACLFMGSPSDCEEIADDLWHRGIQAEVTDLTGSEMDFNVL